MPLTITSTHALCIHPPITEPYTRTPTQREEKRGVLAYAFLGASAISSFQPAIFSKSLHFA